MIDHASLSSELSHMQKMYSDHLRGMVQERSASRYFEAALTTGVLGTSDATSKNFTVPVRLGAVGAALFRSQQSSYEEVAAVAACGATGDSLALSASGQLLQLKVPRRRWAAAAHQLHLSDRHAALLLPTPPCALLSQVLAENGGAVQQISAGAGYFAALTASKKVILWLNSSITSVTGAPLKEAVEEQRGEHVKLRALGDTLLVEFTGLPPIVEIAAGHRALVMTDGQSVWQVPVHSSPNSTTTTNTTTTTNRSSTFQPERVLHLSDECVSSLAAGGASAAAVTDSGRLWLWGDVLLRKKAAQMMQSAEEEEGFGHWSSSGGGSRSKSSSSHSSSSVDSEDGSKHRWAGLGSPTPVVVPGLHGCKRIALGAGHALVEVA